MARLRVFIGYGYNARDAWVETLVVPFVKAFGCDVVHGKSVYGGTLSAEVVRSIQSSDAMIGFTTRRDPDPVHPGLFTTHPWVVQELAIALGQAPPLPYVEVREDNVVSPGGALDAMNAQRIDYRAADQADCLLRIAQALERFASAARVTAVRLAPLAVSNELQALVGDATFVCFSQIFRRGKELPPQQAAVLPIKGALFVNLIGIEADDLIRFRISAAGRMWRSDYESVDTVDVQMKGV